MQAVILCAGKGARMGELTRELPKPLLPVGGKTLLERKLEKLPDSVTEIILVIGHCGEKVISQIGPRFAGRPVRYVEDTTISGTAHALWHARELLTGRFLVMMGDDLYSREAMEECLKHDFSIACKRAERGERGGRIILDNEKRLMDFVTPKLYESMREDGGLVFTGLYSFTPEIFDYEPVKLELRDEWGLPQTLLKAAKDHSVCIVETDFWISVTDPDDLKAAEKIL